MALAMLMAECCRPGKWGLLLQAIGPSATEAASAIGAVLLLMSVSRMLAVPQETVYRKAACTSLTDNRRSSISMITMYAEIACCLCKAPGHALVEGLHGRFPCKGFPAHCASMSFLGRNPALVFLWESAIAPSHGNECTISSGWFRPAWRLVPGGLPSSRCRRAHWARKGLAADTALVLTTSGTTAEPRLVPLSHANLLAAADSIRAVLQLTPEDRCLDPMPLAHIHELSLVLASLLSGSRVHLPGPFAQYDVLEAWQQLRPTWYSAAPAMHALIADWLGQRPDLLSRSSLRYVRSASGPMPRDLLERLLDVPLIEAYGMTDAAPQISSNRLPPHPRKPGSVGKAAHLMFSAFSPRLGVCGKTA